MNVKENMSPMEVSPDGGRQDLNNTSMWTLTP